MAQPLPNVTTLTSPKPTGRSTSMSRVALAQDQSHLPDAHIAQRPRDTFRSTDDEQPVKNANVEKVSKEEISLKMAPIVVRKDVELVGTEVTEPDEMVDGDIAVHRAGREALGETQIHGEEFTLEGDGTSQGNLRIAQQLAKRERGELETQTTEPEPVPEQEYGSVIKVDDLDELRKQAAARPEGIPGPPTYQLDEPQSGTVSYVPPQPPRPSVRVTFQRPGLGKVNCKARDVLVGPRVVIVVYDADAESSYEPEPCTFDDQLMLITPHAQYHVMCADMTVQRDGDLYLVFPRALAGDG